MGRQSKRVRTHISLIRLSVESSIGGFPRLPGRLVSRAWIESSAPRHVVADGALADPSRHSSPLPSVPAGPSQPFECPPHLPPTLFYGSQRQPLIIGAEEGGFESLGGRLPGKDLTVREIARLVGQDRMVDVIG